MFLSPTIPVTFMRSVSKLGLSIRRIVTYTTTTRSDPHVSTVDKPHVLSPMRVLSLNVRGLGSLDKVRWVKELKRMECPSVIGLQETKIKDVDDALVRGIWNGSGFGFAKSEANNRSGGILTIWDANVFVRKQTIEELGLLAVVGDWKGIKGNVGFINVHGPHTCAEKKVFWNHLLSVTSTVDVAWCVFGDFNEVTCSEERLNTQVNSTSVADFNDFIRSSCLIDLPLDGRKFTRVDDNALKFSKLDRVLVREVFLDLWPSLVVVALDRKLSDHCPIILKTRDVEVGRKLCHPYYVWLSEADVADVVNRAWNLDVTSTASDDVFRDKLNNVKLELMKWNKLRFGIVDNELELLMKEVSVWELEAENRPLSDIELQKWKDARKQWIEKDKSLGIGLTKWKGSIKIRDRNNLGIGVSGSFGLQVSDGCVTYFWLHEWLGKFTLRDKFPRLFRLASDTDILVNESGVWVGHEWRWVWKWNAIPRSISLLGELEALSKIVNSFQPVSKCGDRWRLLLVYDGGFIEETLEILVRDRLFDRLGPSRVTKWTHIVPRKVRDFAWRLQRGDRPPPRPWRIGNFYEDKLCSCCGDALQTIDHCIIQCTHNASVWSSVFQWWDLGCFDGTSISDVLYHKGTASFSRKQKLLWTAVFWSTAYIIWTYEKNPTPSKNKNVIQWDSFSKIQSWSHIWISERFKEFGFSWSEWCSNPSARNG